MKLMPSSRCTVRGERFLMEHIHDSYGNKFQLSLLAKLTEPNQPPSSPSPSLSHCMSIHFCILAYAVNIINIAMMNAWQKVLHFFLQRLCSSLSC